MSEVQGQAELDKRLAAITDTRKLLGQLVLMAVALAKQTVRRKTGNLGRTIRPGQITDRDAEIIAGGQLGVGYAGVVEYGSKPHLIVPRYASTLRIPVGATRLSGNARSGAPVIFRKRVNHPGTKPYPYLMPAAQQVTERYAGGLIVKAWNEAA